MPIDIPAICYPSLASVRASQQATDAERALVWDKMARIRGRDRDLFFSQELAHFIYNLQQEYRLQDVAVEEVSRTVRRWFFGEIDDAAFAAHVGDVIGRSVDVGAQILGDIRNIRVMPKTDTTREPSTSTHFTQDDTTGAEVTQSLDSHLRGNDNVGNVQNLGRRMSKGTAGVPQNVQQMTLGAALAQYPSIKRQKVSGELIVTKPILKPLVPTVENWLEVYDKVLGVEPQNTVARGEFLYRSQACRSMRESDRRHLAELLHARDESSRLSIDVDRGRIVWQENTHAAHASQEKPAPQKHSTHIPAKPARERISKQQSPAQVLHKHAPVGQRREVPQETPRVASVPKDTQAVGTITSLEDMRGVKTAAQTVSPQHFNTPDKPASERVSSFRVAPSTQKKLRPAARIIQKNPQQITKQPQSKTQQTPVQREKLDRLIRAHTPYAAHAPQGKPRAQEVQQEGRHAMRESRKPLRATQNIDAKQRSTFAQNAQQANPTVAQQPKHKLPTPDTHTAQQAKKQSKDDKIGKISFSSGHTMPKEAAKKPSQKSGPGNPFFIRPIEKDN